MEKVSNKKMIVIGLLIILIGALCFFAGSFYFSNKCSEKPVIISKNETEKVIVPVAKEYIETDTVISIEHLDFKSVDKNSIEENTLQNIEDIVGKTVVGDNIKKGSAFLKGNLTGRELEYVAPVGYTLYSIPISNVESFGNTILTGDAVQLYIKLADPVNSKVAQVPGTFEIISRQNSKREEVSDYATPEYIVIAVPDCVYPLLVEVSRLSDARMALVPETVSYTNMIETNVITYNELEDLIVSKSGTDFYAESGVDKCS